MRREPYLCLTPHRYVARRPRLDDHGDPAEGDFNFDPKMDDPDYPEPTEEEADDAGEPIPALDLRQVFA